MHVCMYVCLHVCFHAYMYTHIPGIPYRPRLSGAAGMHGGLAQRRRSGYTCMYTCVYSITIYIYICIHMYI